MTINLTKLILDYMMLLKIYLLIITPTLQQLESNFFCFESVEEG